MERQCCGWETPGGTGRRARSRWNDSRNSSTTGLRKGFNVGQLFFAANGWGRDSTLLDRTFTEPNLERIRHVEQMISYANSKGITVWVHGWWSREDMKQRVGEENIRRWTRYMVHRLSALNVVWVLAGEYNMHNYGGLGLDFWKKLGQLVAQEDPYGRIIGVHPTPPGWSGGEDAPQWSTAEVLNSEPWLSYNQSQVGHGRWRNELIPRIVDAAYRQQPAKPIVVTEPWYEFIEGNPTAADIRFGGWSAVLSGAAGHSYGGGHVWLAHVPESPEQARRVATASRLRDRHARLPGSALAELHGEIPARYRLVVVGAASGAAPRKPVTLLRCRAGPRVRGLSALGWCGENRPAAIVA